MLFRITDVSSPPLDVFNQLKNLLARVSSTSLEIIEERACFSSSYSESLTCLSSLSTSLSMYFSSFEHSLSYTGLHIIIEWRFTCEDFWLGFKLASWQMLWRNSNLKMFSHLCKTFYVLVLIMHFLVFLNK